jgi:vacuolar-type H+-ATPase subunit F/Vma7
MQSEIRRVRRPLTNNELDILFIRKDTSEDLKGVIQKISLEHVSIEERRKEANKPLYLVRYE